MKVPFSVSDVVRWTRGELIAGDEHARLAGASIDTRTLAQGELFVAIAGPQHDAHDYLERAVGGGAAALLVQSGRDLPDLDAPIVAVPDTTRALGDLAAGHRSGFDGPVVAITGSNGKTSTKEMCAGILAVGAPTLRNRGNLNNQFGLPLTLLAREDAHRRIVTEMGMNHRGEIAELAAIARPDVGVVTNVGSAHIEHLGSREAIAAEKGDLLAAVPSDGVCVVNTLDDREHGLAGRCRARVVRFGDGPDADVRAEEPVWRPRAGRVEFVLCAPEGRSRVEVAGLAETAVANALAATAAALAAGATLAEVAEGLAGYRPAPGRLERAELPGEIALIDDSYNANPESMGVALRVLASCEGGRRIAALGDMGELGDAAEEAHTEAGRLAARLGVDWLLAVGERAGSVAAGARDAGMSGTRILTFSNSEEAAGKLRELLEKGDWLLLKGSRSTKMERIRDLLKAEAST